MSMVRVGCYRIGPAICLALDAAGVDWRGQVDNQTDLAQFVDAALSSLHVAKDRAGFDHILVQVEERDATIRVGKDRRRLAFSGPLLKITVEGIMFYPRYVEEGEHGTVYVNGFIQSPSVNVEAHDGMVIAPNFSYALLACPNNPEPRAEDLSGPGWTGRFVGGWEQFAEWATAWV